jgi:hypothetical protein
MRSILAVELVVRVSLVNESRPMRLIRINHHHTARNTTVRQLLVHAGNNLRSNERPTKIGHVVVFIPL